MVLHDQTPCLHFDQTPCLTADSFDQTPCLRTSSKQVCTYQVQASPSLLEISPDHEKARIASAVQARQRLRRPPLRSGPSGDAPGPLRPGVRGESSSRFPTKPADSRTRFARQSDVRAVRRRPGRKRSWEPSRRDKYGRERPQRRGGGIVDTSVDTSVDTPPSTDRASGQKGGVAPVQSLPAGAARAVRSSSKSPSKTSG